LDARLRTHGYELLQAADGEEALAVARAQLPGLILLDVMMPKLDGLEVCRPLQGGSSLPFMPIILVTAKADSSDLVRGRGPGSGRVSRQAGRPAGAGRARALGAADQGAA